MRGGYKTEQKQSLVSFFHDNKDRHFTVDEVCLNLKNSGNPVARSTVYRQINALLGDGVLRRFESEAASSFVYQYADIHDDCNSHYHMKCVKCGRLLHIRCPYLEKASAHCEEEHKFIIGSRRAVLYGECVKCAKK